MSSVPMFTPPNSSTSGNQYTFGMPYQSQNQYGNNGFSIPTMNYGYQPPPSYGGGGSLPNPISGGGGGFSGAGTAQGAPGSVPMPSQPNVPTTYSGTTGGAVYPGDHAQVPTGSEYGLGHSQWEVPPADPQLQTQLMNWLQQQIGTGITPYDLQAALPTGGVTGPGQVASPLDPVTQQLMQFFTTGNAGNNAGLGALQGMAQTGDPISALPEWQAMVQAAQQQINEGGANVREQLAFTGNLPGSAGATGISDYYTNANSQLTSQLISAQTAALQQAQQNKLTAGTVLEQAQQGLGSSLYSYDQNAIQQLMNEYFQTTPQENPLNQEIFSGGTTYAPTYGKAATPGIASQLLSAAPGLAGAVGSGISAGLGAAGGGAGLLGSILTGLAAL